LAQIVAAHCSDPDRAQGPKGIKRIARNSMLLRSGPRNTQPCVCTRCVWVLVRNVIKQKYYHLSDQSESDWIGLVVILSGNRFLSNASGPPIKGPRPSLGARGSGVRLREGERGRRHWRLPP
jgi:hypothetical protein